MLFAILKTKKLQANCNLRKIHRQFGQRNSGEQHKGRQRSDSAESYANGFPKSIDQQSHILTKNHLQIQPNSSKIHRQFGQRNSGEQHKGRQRSDSAESYANGFPKSIDQQSHILTKNHLQIQPNYGIITVLSV